jgi:hypothetical protein
VSSWFGENKNQPQRHEGTKKNTKKKKTPAAKNNSSKDWSHTRLEERSAETRNPNWPLRAESQFDGGRGALTSGAWSVRGKD